MRIYTGWEKIHQDLYGIGVDISGSIRDGRRYTRIYTGWDRIYPDLYGMGEDISGFGLVELRYGDVVVWLDEEGLAVAAHEAVDLVRYLHPQLLRPKQI